MNSLAQPVADANQLVANYKRAAYLVMHHAILGAALRHPRGYVFPGDVPEDLIAKADRQGVASNAWNNPESLGILEMVSPNLNDPEHGIVNGQKQNRNISAKGRWTAVYRLVSVSAAQTWLERNPLPATPPPKLENRVQVMLI